MSATEPTADRISVSAGREAKVRWFLIVLACGILVASFGTWETSTSEPIKAFGEDSPWSFSREVDKSGWQTGTELPAGRLPNGVVLVAAILAALAGAMGGDGGTLRRRITLAGLSILCTAAIAYWGYATKQSGGYVGDAAVVAAGMSLLAAALTVTRAGSESPATSSRA